MRHVGEAVRDYTVAHGNKKKIVAIGIATWGCVSNKDALVDPKGCWPAEYRHDSANVRKQSPLDPNHSHFILVDNGTQHQFAVEIPFRASLESKIANMKTDSRDESECYSLEISTDFGKFHGNFHCPCFQLMSFKHFYLYWKSCCIILIKHGIFFFLWCKFCALVASQPDSVSVPIVCVALEGGPGTLETVKSAIQSGTPAVIVEVSMIDREKQMSHLSVTRKVTRLTQCWLVTGFRQSCRCACLCLCKLHRGRGGSDWQIWQEAQKVRGLTSGTLSESSTHERWNLVQRSFQSTAEPLTTFSIDTCSFLSMDSAVTYHLNWWLGIDDEHWFISRVVAIVDNEVWDGVRKMIMNEWGDRDIDRRVNWVKECLQKRDHMTVFRLDGTDSIRDIDLAILQALLKGSSRQL